ncbi:exported hypothetical protein [Vibrio nigripulchritudo MADA3029]|uniref:hypothetical protein n=1 Tax=Vibrio nigripulchritudo TaxID=28173 RepID=UPI00021C1872|nr:hypothetical protein [Vibrio nigripulchritudo]EGU57571.1 hypothetical protein VINI7043_07145 [Vibrio nigripulchritudo ATCC 27043]CCN45833.1 exported hypothetical protein [Vibrio nigripulchritudo MADA3020]CCN52613.1 exported hypothetical protein [Vibrio nigripulchritudo MADA3021]CCN61465.1 exported hypothetical protein [Vibrio nigripulchritudo MADA3029]
MKFFIALTIAVCSFATHASQQTTLAPQTLNRVASGWGGEGIYLYSKEKLTVSGCKNPVYVIKKHNNVLFSEMVSMALSAYHAKSKVAVRTDGCDGDSGRAMNIIAIDLLD